jgi:lactoylglutathione lyase
VKTAYGHVNLRVTDVAASIDFYVNMLGFKEMFRLNNDKGELGIVYLQIDGLTFIELSPRAKVRGVFPPELVGYNHLCLHVDDIEQAMEELRQKGYPIEGTWKQGRDGNRQYWITDPDGLRIELMQLNPEGEQMKAVRRLAAEQAAASGK